MSIETKFIPASLRGWARHPAGWRRSWQWLSLLILVGNLSFGADEPISKDYQLKAAFLFNFTKFVEWPAGRFANETSPIVIGVVGRNPFGDELKKIVQGRLINGRAILVKTIQTTDGVDAVQVLFVPAGEEVRLPAAVWQNVSILAVGESAGFAALGATITFTYERDKMRFEINIAAAERSHLKISAQLQKLASVVRREP